MSKKSTLISTSDIELPQYWIAAAAVGSPQSVRETVGGEVNERENKCNVIKALKHVHKREVGEETRVEKRPGV